MARPRHAAAALLAVLGLALAAVPGPGRALPGPDAPSRSPAPPASASPGAAREYRIDPARSVFAVLTHKAGIAAGLAHDHLIVANQPTMRLEFDPAVPAATRFSFAIAVEALEVDAPGPRAAWKGRFKELGIHSGELPIVPDADRKKVRAAMLGESQLDGAKFPEIRAEVLELARRAPVAATPGAEPGWDVALRLTIRGKTIERRLPATFRLQSETLAAEVVGEFHFRDFGIEPYSTMLGAIRNDDLFHLFVSVVAAPAP